MTIQIEWLERTLNCIAAFGVFLGALSVISPKRSIQLYQWMMRIFNWRVEPINYERELRNTRALGGLMIIVSLLLIAALLRPRWFSA